MDTGPDGGAALRCLFVGKLESHATMGRVAALIAAGCETYLVNAGDADWPHKDYPISQARIVDRLTEPFYRDRSSSHRKRFISEYLRILGLVPEDRDLAQSLASSYQYACRLNLLKATRQTCPDSVLIHRSTNKV